MVRPGEFTSVITGLQASESEVLWKLSNEFHGEFGSKPPKVHE